MIYKLESSDSEKYPLFPPIDPNLLDEPDSEEDMLFI